MQGSAISADAAAIARTYWERARAGAQASAPDPRSPSVAAALRRAELLEALLDQIRLEPLAPVVMQTILQAAIGGLGAHGAAVLDLGHPPEVNAVLHQAGAALDPHLAELLPTLRGCSGAASCRATDALHALSCPLSTRFGHEAALVVWRPLAESAWEGGDDVLLAAIAGLVRIVLEHEAVQRELARQARTDALTGLLNRRTFTQEAKARIDRLDRDHASGTLILIDLDQLRNLNDGLGYEMGDVALLHTATLLRRLMRPADLVARTGGDEFAIWADGLDHLSAAERAEHLRLFFPTEMARFTASEHLQLTMSIGIACRQPGQGEELDDVMARAAQALHEAKRGGPGQWRVSRSEPVT